MKKKKTILFGVALILSTGITAVGAHYVTNVNARQQGIIVRPSERLAMEKDAEDVKTQLAFNKSITAFNKALESRSEADYGEAVLSFSRVPLEERKGLLGLQDKVEKAVDARRTEDKVNAAKEKALAEVKAMADLSADEVATFTKEIDSAKTVEAPTEAVTESKAKSDANRIAREKAEAEKKAAQEAQRAREAEEAAKQAQSAKSNNSNSSSSNGGNTARSANTISFGGVSMPIVDSQGTGAAPQGWRAGYWQGNGNVDDGVSTHIIGHNPGSFAGVMNMGIGSAITVTDRNGKTRTYHVYWVNDVNDDCYDRNGIDQWEPVMEQAGESISLQTCISHYWNRIVLAH